MHEKELTKFSKFLSLVLRHQPELIGIQLDEQGWTSVDELLQKASHHGTAISHELLREIVETNSKKRFALSEDGKRIRANQGHSVEVALGYDAQIPPEVLYHGTAEKNMVSIRTSGIQKQSRHHVHLSASKETALQVGQRHGKPVVLTIHSGQMHRDGLAFYLSENGVWLTDQVHLQYIQFDA